DGDPFAAERRDRSHRHQGCDPRAAQRLPSSQAEARVMARYTGPVCRLCRRERMKLYLKGAQCDTMKCPIERRPSPPGEAGQTGQRRGAEPLVNSGEKQKARRISGLREKECTRPYGGANRRQGVTGENLLQLRELRLDNVVFRAGWGASR